MTHQPTPEEQVLLQATALRTAANAVVITDRAGTILWVNPAFNLLTGYSLEEVVGRNPRLLKSGEHDHQFYRQFWETIASGRTWKGEFTNRHKDGQLYCDEHTVTPVRGPDGTITHFVGIMLDVTARKRAEQEIHRLNTELEQRVLERTAELQAANRELEAFSYSVSHDLRAPLRHIEGFAALLNRGAGSTLDPDNRHCLEAIGEAAKRMAKLIDDLLEFSRVGRTELRYEPIDLGQLARETISQLQPDTQGRNIRWKTGDLPSVQGDPAMLRQVLLNLLANALKYTRPRNPAEIELGSLNGDPKEVVIFVRDNGVGFDMNYSDNLFGVFQRLHAEDEFEGTGIGLANVRRIISRHHGRTWAEAKVNEGACFFFSLPKSPSNQTQLAAAADI